MTDAPVLSFPHGLVGFAGPRRFHLVRWGGEDSPFSLLRAVGDGALDFVVMPPAAFFSDYEPEIDADIAADLDLGTAGDALVLVIVTVPDQVHHATANLLGPLVVNATSLVGRQAVLSPERWSSRRPLLGDAATTVA